MSGAFVFNGATPATRAAARPARRLRGARALATLLLLLLCALQLLCLLRAPPAWVAAELAVALDTDRALLLDGAALGLPPAEGARIRLRRDAGGAWWVASAGQAAVLVQRGQRHHRAGSVLLAPGQRFQLGAARFGVDAADAAALVLTRAATRYGYDGATLLRNGRPQPACPNAGLGARLAGAWRRWLPPLPGMQGALVFGGNLDCGNRIAIAGVPPAAASVKPGPDGMLLAGGAAARQAPLLFRDALPDDKLPDDTLPDDTLPDDARLLDEREQSLAQATALQLGRSRLLLEQEGGVLRLRPVARAAFYHEPGPRQPDGVAWHWTRRADWRLPPQAALPLALALAGGLAALAALLRGGTARRLGPARTLGAAGAVVLMLAGAALLYLQKSGTPAGAGPGLLLAWAGLWCAWLAAGRALATRVAVLLLATGLLVQLEMGLGAPDTSWLRHAGKSGAMLAIGAGALGLLRALRGAGAAPLPQARAELGLLAGTGLALLLLALQAGLGDETGVFDLQPVEFAKFTLAALGAHCLALAAGGQPAPGGTLLRLLRLGAPALLFLALLAVALVQVDDYSPLVLLALWGAVLALAYALGRRNALLAGALLAGALAAVGALVLLRAAGADAFARWNFYADRFLVWLDPASHPHTGQQLLLGAQAIAGGGWFGADGALGLATLGQDAGAVLRIPAVQDDFAPSFLLHRHGLVAALLLWLLQALFLAGLLHAALRCWLAGAGARDFRLAWLARFRCFLLCGGAAFVAGHLLLSWGTNLAIFPVMGQPMSFLSAGGSHLLFFIFPLLAVDIGSDTEHR